MRAGAVLDPKRDLATGIVNRVRAGRRTILTEYESKQLLAAYGIPTVRTELANNADEAVKKAGEIGYPVVLKLHSETITHKTDVGGVKLNLRSPTDVSAAFAEIQASVTAKVGAEHFLGVTVQPFAKLDGYELIIGSSIDPQLGPVLLFGTGGQLVEVFRDRALGLPPLNTTLARRMMEQTRILAALKGVRGRQAVDLAALEQLLVRFSDLVVQQRWIREIDINPLLASPERLLALDARVIVHGPGVTESGLPRPAIRPYPTHLVSSWTANDGSTLLLRPIRPEDEPMLVAFHGTLSERTVALRYFHAMKLSARVAHERLTRICFIDYDREMALVAERPAPDAEGGREILGVGRLSKLRGTDDAEFALLISDRFQRRGLGTALLGRLVGIARDEVIRRIVGSILPENLGMRRVCERLGFRLSHDPDNGVIIAELVP
jgi:acetyltransferase